jgi:hypothetical protein
MGIEQPFRLSIFFRRSRSYGEIIADLLSERNTGKMSGLLSELSESLDKGLHVARTTADLPGAGTLRRVIRGRTGGGPVGGAEK